MRMVGAGVVAEGARIAVEGDENGGEFTLFYIFFRFTINKINTRKDDFEVRILHTGLSSQSKNNNL